MEDTLIHDDDASSMLWWANNYLYYMRTDLYPWITHEILSVFHGCEMNQPIRACVENNRPIRARLEANPCKYWIIFHGLAITRAHFVCKIKTDDQTVEFDFVSFLAASLREALWLVNCFQHTLWLVDSFQVSRHHRERVKNHCTDASCI